MVKYFAIIVQQENYHSNFLIWTMNETKKFVINVLIYIGDKLLKLIKKELRNLFEFSFFYIHVYLSEIILQNSYC